MFKTRKVIAEIFSIVGTIRQQCTLNFTFQRAGGGPWYTSSPILASEQKTPPGRNGLSVLYLLHSQV
jgi:hypothetical protein